MNQPPIRFISLTSYFKDLERLKKIKKAWQNTWAVGILAPLFLTPILSLQGCAPPPTKGTSTTASNPSAQSPNMGGGIETGGKQILAVHPTPRPPFQTVEKNGVEYRISRGKVGKPGGTFYDSGLGDGPKTFNPWASFDATSSTTGGMMASSLMETDAYTGDVIPYLAKSFEVLPDHLTYRVTLRKGLVWSDGHPLTTDDVVFTWNDILGKGLGNPSSRDNLLIDQKFPEIKALSPLQVEFKTAKPFAPFLRLMGATNIAPKHIFAPIIKAGGDKAFSAAWGPSDAEKNPEKFVSSGMWLLEKYEQHERVTFKRNPKFFMQDSQGQPLPYLDRYITTYVKDLNNMQLQFEQGKVDNYSIPAQFVAHVRKQEKPAFDMYNLGPTTGTTFITFNLRQDKDKSSGKPKVDPIKSTWFNNQKFRQAVDWAINRKDMVNNILKNVGAPLFTAEPLNSIFLNHAIAEGHPQDLAKAKAFLKEGGFHWNTSGHLEDAQGHPVEFNLLTNTGNDQREATGVNIKQDLSQLGMKVNFKPMEFNVLIDKLNGSGEWEAIIMGLTGGTLEPHFGTNVWRSNGALHMFNQRDIKTLKGSTPSNVLPWEAEIDRLFEQGAQEFDLAKRKEIYNKFQLVVYEQLPFIYLYSPLSMIAVKKRIQNFDPTPLSVFHNLEELWIDNSQDTTP
ncbi:MAG: ABC transporter substrate-binding protein [Cyanobacteria bacterium]|nr:ABC transporter substrate-binding protein [Cyanobacteriota bacterium]